MPIQPVKRGDTVLEARGITKRFPGVVANDHIDFEIRAGEIHAILGENGAGKTTLMKILFGLLQPDEGEIYVHGEKVAFRSPLDAIHLGIGMVHQNRKLIPAHTVLENIILGHPKAGSIPDMRRTRVEIAEICDRYGFKIDLKAKVWQLSEGEKQAVEILKTLYRGARILILDEPTSALAPPETEKLLASIRIMTGDDLALVPFITHKLPIVLDISERVTVLRRGKVTARLRTSEATENSLAKEMVGREVIFRLDHVDVEQGKPILEVEDLSALNDKGQLALQGVSFTVHEGEIFGIAGVSGNGQQVLAEVLAGLRKAVTGRVLMDGIDITRSSSLERWKSGMGYIPSDRIDVGSIGAYTLMDNVLMNYYFDRTFSTWGIVRFPEDAQAHRRTHRRVRHRHPRPRHHGQEPVRRQSPEADPGPGAVAQTAAHHRQPSHPGAGCGRHRIRPEQAAGSQAAARRHSAHLGRPGRGPVAERSRGADLRGRVHGHPPASRPPGSRTSGL